MPTACSTDPGIPRESPHDTWGCAHSVPRLLRSAHAVDVASGGPPSAASALPQYSETCIRPRRGSSDSQRDDCPAHDARPSDAHVWPEHTHWPGEARLAPRTHASTRL